LAIVDICSIASLDTRGDGAASAVKAVLANGRGTELLVVVFTGCVGVIGGASASAVPLVLHLKRALVVGLVGAGSSEALGTGLLAVWSSVVFTAASVIADVELMGVGLLSAGSSEALGIGFLATWSSVVEAASAIAAVLALFDPSACSAARLGLLIDICVAWAVLAVRSPREA